MKIYFVLISLLFLSQVSAADSSNAINSLDERLTDLELKSLAQKIDMGLEVKTMGGYVRITNNDPNAAVAQYGTKSDSQFGALIRLNLNAKVNDQLKFYSSLQTFRHFNDAMIDYSGTGQQVLTQVNGGETVRLFKGYFDYHFNPVYTLSVGRLPTTQGPPIHLKEGKSRTGTYPLTAYSVPLDGIALTVNLQEAWNLPFNFYSRSIYKPGSITDDTFFYKRFQQTPASKPVTYSVNTQILTQMFDFEHEDPSLNWWKRANFILQGSYFKFANMKPQNGPYGSSIYSSDNIALKTYLLTGYLELEKILRSNFDFYLSYTWSKISDTSSVFMYSPLGTTAAYPGDNMGNFIGSKGHNARRILTGFRHEFVPTNFWGAEFNYASKDAVPTSFYTDNMFNNYLNTGKSYQLYYLKRLFNGAAFLQVSYVNMLMTQSLQSGFSYSDDNRRIQTVYSMFGFQI